MMKKSLNIILLSVGLSLGLVSCSQDGLVRINDRPLNQPILVNNDLSPAAVTTAPPSLLDQLGNTNTIGANPTTPALVSPTVLTPGTAPVNPVVPSNPGAPAISGLDNLIKPPTLNNPTLIPSAPQAQPPVATNLPVATPVPGDRTVVFSPYSPGKKVSIKKKDGTPYAAGTKMRDPYSPGGQGMFRIP